MVCRQLQQSRGQLLLGQADERATFFGGQDGRHREPGTLSLNPVKVPEGERVSFTLRASSRDGDANAAVGLDAQQIAPGAPVADEVKLMPL